MGIVTRLRGQEPKGNKKTIKCPDCGRELIKLHIVKTKKEIQKVCPYCSCVIESDIR